MIPVKTVKERKFSFKKKRKKNPDSTFDLFLFLNCSPTMSKVRLSFKITSLCGTNASNLITILGKFIDHSREETSTNMILTR